MLMRIDGFSTSLDSFTETSPEATISGSSVIRLAGRKDFVRGLLTLSTLVDATETFEQYRPTTYLRKCGEARE